MVIKFECVFLELAILNFHVKIISIIKSLCFRKFISINVKVISIIAYPKYARMIEVAPYIVILHIQNIQE